jgi:divalent metal cation (Fe/Co/Zn/Cd) transporter
METFGIILILVVIVEALIEYFGTPIPSAYKPYVAAVVGVLLCLGYGADLLAALGYPAGLPYVGTVLTGLLISRGSNVFNDLVSRLNTRSAPATTVDAVERRAASA